MTEINKENFDYEGYEKSLEKILEQASKDYWNQHIDINRHQINVARTYMWVSAALVGFYFTAISQIIKLDVSSNLYPCFWLLAGGAVLSTAVAFGICLYALPGRKGYLKVNDSWSKFSLDAYGLLESESTAIYRSILTDMIEKFDLASEHGRRTNSTRAKLLRKTSMALITAFILGLITALYIGITFFN